MKQTKTKYGKIKRIVSNLELPYYRYEQLIKAIFQQRIDNFDDMQFSHTIMAVILLIMWQIEGKNILLTLQRISQMRSLEEVHKIENFVKNFAKDYYTWQPSQASIDSRNEAIKKYLTEELQNLNGDTIRRDIPTSSTVQNVEIWSVKQDGEKQFQVVFTVEQAITEGENKKDIQSSYEVVVYVDDSGNMIIIKNPTICSIPSKSSYESKVKESEGTVDAATNEEVNEFLKTFFKLYPTATEILWFSWLCFRIMLKIYQFLREVR